MADKKEEKKEKKEQKPNPIRQWYRETVGELRKVSWPSWREAWRLTRIVLMVMVAMAITLGLLDWGFSKLVELLLA